MSVLPPVDFPVSPGQESAARATTPDLTDPVSVAVEVAKLSARIAQLVSGNPRLLSAARQLMAAMAEGGPRGTRKGPVIPPGLQIISGISSPAALPEQTGPASGPPAAGPAAFFRRP